MRSATIYAGPAFAAAIVGERWVRRRRGLPYDDGDAWASFGTGVFNQVEELGWEMAEVALLKALAKRAPRWLRRGGAGAARTTTGKFWLTMLAVDLAYYWYHRHHHEIRALWAVHVTHHSSEQYNFATATRQPWEIFTSGFYLAPLALLGLDPETIVASWAWNLFYQFWIHTELVGKLPKAIEAVLNTPSHHRAHHGSNRQYLDRNYGGILILWDRLWGTFEPEDEPVVYGLTKNIRTNNVWSIETHEWAAIWRDLKQSRDPLALFGPTGWSPG